MSETPIHNLLTVKETAEYLRIPPPTVYYLVQHGKIPAIQIGGRWRMHLPSPRVFSRRGVKAGKRRLDNLA